MAPSDNEVRSAREAGDERSTLYLIDGHAQFFRAFHAIRTPMTSPVTKEPTNATFGFVGVLLKILRTQRPDYLAVAIDASGDRGTFRSEIYPEYKANRAEPPEALAPQVERCVSLLEEVETPVLGVEGVEADDTVATLVERLKASHPDLRIRIVSKDKDLMQLLEPGRVEMYDPYNDEVITAESLQEDKGVTPDQVVDMLALMGDSIDNVPGVEGVGQKTAAQLIEKWGSLDNLLAHAEEIKGKRGERLRAAAATLPLSKQLVTLRRDVPLEFDLERAQTAQLRLEKLEPILRELGFNRRREELRELLEGDGRISSEPTPSDSGDAPATGFDEGLFAQRSAPAVKKDGDYQTVRTRADLKRLAKALKSAPIFAIDCETTNLAPMRAELCGLAFSTKAGTGWYVPVRSPEPEAHLSEHDALDGLRAVLEDPDRPKCGHNLKYDLLVLRRAGVELRGVDFDSMVASYLVDPARSSHGLDALALALLGYSCTPISDLIGSGAKQRTFDTVPLDVATEYAAEDADISLRLRDVLLPQLKAMGLASLAADVETPLVEVLAELQWNGIRVDPEELDRQAERLTQRLEELRERIVDEAPREFNPDSPKQLAGLLFNKADDPNLPGLGLKPLKRTKTGYSTDIEVLEKLAADASVETEIPKLILEHRQLSKLVGTYLAALKDEIHPETGRIHASFNQTVAATGRLSSSDPNLQNIPIRTDIGREIRKAFVAPDGRALISADYSQIELRMLAHLSQDEALTEAFRSGQDIHRAVAAQIHEVEPEEVTDQQRSGAKMVNFGIVYGVTPFGLARRLGIGEKEAGTIIDEYKARFPGITTFLQECVEQAQRHGYVETILKRRRPIPQLESRQPQQRSLGERMAINSVVQGSAADLIKLAMLDLHRRLSEHAPHWRRAAGMDEAPEVPDVLMLLQIHDELVFEAPRERAEEARDLIKARMEAAMDLRVPLEVDAAIAGDWFEAK